MRLCLVGHSAEGLFGQTPGGSERQLALLATHLARRGNQVTMVVTGYSGTEGQVQGVELRAGWDDRAGVRLLRAVSYRYPHLKRVLSSARADAYYGRGVSLASVSLVTAAREADSVSLIALCSDRDCFADSGKYHFGRGGPLTTEVTGRLGYEYFRRRGLQRADCVVVQNRAQARACAGSGLPHRLLPSIVPSPPNGLSGMRASADVVWVGNVGFRQRRPKGTRELADLAERLPHVRFSIVGRLDAPQLHGTLARLRRLPNVTLHGFLEHDETLERIASARLVLNTSPSEGFSNVMLEGWSLRKPTVSLTVDPSRLLSHGGLGLCAAGSLEVMTASLDSLLSDERLRSSMGEAGHDYVTRVHGPDAVCDRFESLVSRLAAKR